MNTGTKNLRIIVEKDIADRASSNALRGGATLVRRVENFITELATKPSKVKDKDAFIQEKDATKEDWCASRTMLYAMREQNELKEKVHYEIREGAIFYRLEKLKAHFKENYPHIEEAKRRKNEPITG
jgi:hypothetical protein